MSRACSALVLTSTSEACAREHKSAVVYLKSKVVRALAPKEAYASTQRARGLRTDRNGGSQQGAQDRLEAGYGREIKGGVAPNLLPYT